MHGLLVAGISLAFGTYIGLLRPQFSWLYVVGLGCLLLGWGYGREWGRRFLSFALVLCAFGAGGVLGAGANSPPSFFWQKLFQEAGWIRGEIIPASVKVLEHGSIKLLLQESSTGKNIRVLLTKWPHDRRFPRYGEVQLWGRLEPLPCFFNPGQLNQADQQKANNIWAAVRADSRRVRIKLTRPGWNYYLWQLTEAIDNKLACSMATKDHALLRGMALGGAQNIEGEVLDNFKAVGIIHLLAVSGTHVALVGGAVVGLCHKLGMQNSWTCWVAAFALIFYGLLCGFRPAVSRAVFMGLIYLGGKVLKRKADNQAALGAALIVLLCYNPWWIISVGFQLSFLATGGLIILFKPIRNKLALVLPYKLAAALSVPLAAQLPMLPLLFLYFHQVSWISLAANVLVLPLLSLVLILTLGGIALSFIALPLGKVLLIVAAQGLGMALWGVDNLAQIPSGCITLGTLDSYWGAPPRFTTYFLDVGQGDCAVILTPQRACVVIDTGGLEHYDTGTGILGPVLQYLGVKEVEALVLSHGHHDHAGGAAALTKFVKIKRILLPREPTSPDIEALLKRVKNKSELHWQERGCWQIKDCKLDFLTAPNQQLAREATNESSSLLKVSCQGKSILFTGDASGEMELAALNLPLKAHVLKLSHHGSRYSSEEAFLRSVEPSLAIASCGYRNKFGHPSPAILERLQRLGITCCRTDLKGAIEVSFCGEYLKVKTFGHRQQLELNRREHEYVSESMH